MEKSILDERNQYLIEKYLISERVSLAIRDFVVMFVMMMIHNNSDTFYNNLRKSVEMYIMGLDKNPNIDTKKLVNIINKNVGTNFKSAGEIVHTAVSAKQAFDGFRQNLDDFKSSMRPTNESSDGWIERAKKNLTKFFNLDKMMSTAKEIGDFLASYKMDDTKNILNLVIYVFISSKSVKYMGK